MAQMGFYDSAVAAPSQAAALRAWGTHQDLFASGHARAADDPQAVAAALASPETPLRRLVGTDQPFELNPKGLPDIPDAPKKSAGDVAAKRPPPAPATKLKRPSRKALDRAEAALKTVDGERKREEAEFRQRQDALDAERAMSQTRYVERHRQATATVVEARAAYRQAGGTD